MNILDDLKKIKELDGQDMLGIEERFVDQLVTAQEIVKSADYKNLKNENFKGIAILGMGGSGVSGDIIKNLVAASCEIPIEVIKDYSLPAFVKKGWLVVAISYSGNTEETLHAVGKAFERNCEVMCISSGGKLMEIASAKNKCLVKMPGGFQPRGASGYLFFSTFLSLNEIGIFNVSKADIDESYELLKEKTVIYNRESVTANNPAKQLALALESYMPVVYGVNGFLSAIAYRWKCEINENSKCPCFWAEFPELNHNETVGWENLSEITKKFALIVFKDITASERIKTRIDTTSELIRKNLGKIIEIMVEGRSILARAISTMYLGDIASVYLAFLYNTDPTPVDRISALKAELAKLDK
jgi:bifunctional phosphoglucose/phosphomannose isomerase